MNEGLQIVAAAADFPADRVAARRLDIRSSLLRRSRTIRRGDFDTISAEDVGELFGGYDEAFFERRLTTAANAGRSELRFRVSRNMTVSGGSTRVVRNRMTGVRRLELVVSETLLLLTFRDGRPVRVAGLDCRDRLDALQRVMEHEIVHLVELLAWGRSSCSAPRFRNLARRVFGHTDSTHALTTPRDRAYRELGLKVGNRVGFRIDGRRTVGVLNRITRRATVLVEARNGRRYSDGKRYEKYYVPLEELDRLP